LLRKLIPGRKFDFPKSLYAVEDCLRFFVADNPDAVILDFFGGSGTTAHAVMRLNKQYGGHRRFIIVTNNEVSSDESEVLRGKGLRPGDAEWESLGICEYITKPRIAAAVTGKTHEGKAIVGDYKFTDEFPMSEGFEENIEFFTLTYENPEAVRLDYAFAAIAPLLWLKAGAQGSCIDKREGPFALADHYAVLFDPDQWGRFIKAIKEIDNLRCVYIVTDDDTVFQKVSVKVPREVGGHPVQMIRLYESYLTNFEIKAEG
jgi:adenine-specific DNA-methyltransferase